MAAKVGSYPDSRLKKEYQMATVIEPKIVDKLSTGLTPVHLTVLNESHMHNVPPGSESHFKVVVVSDQFEGKRLVQRHQLVYQLLQDELANGVHALAIHAYTDSEWQKQGAAPDSPQCMG
jgi:BolA protein